MLSTAQETRALMLAPFSPADVQPFELQVAALDQALRQVARLAGEIARDERACPHGLRELARRAEREAEARSTSMGILAEHALVS